MSAEIKKDSAVKTSRRTQSKVYPSPRVGAFTDHKHTKSHRVIQSHDYSDELEFNNEPKNDITSKGSHVKKLVGMIPTETDSDEDDPFGILKSQS